MQTKYPYKNLHNICIEYLGISHHEPQSHAPTSLPTSPSLVNPSPKSQVQFVLPAHSLEHIQTPSGQTLNESEFFSPPQPPPEGITCEELHFSIPITIFQYPIQ